MNDIQLYTALIIAVFSFMSISLIVSFVRDKLRSPFHYPYFVQRFDVTGKRNVDIDNLIDKFLCDNDNWRRIQWHQSHIERWKRSQEEYLKTCKLHARRAKQYNAALDDFHAFQFQTIRQKTRYKQVNYVKTAYTVSTPDTGKFVSWEWIAQRRKLLESIGCEATLKEYNSKTQRNLMTKALRRQIMVRDNYTCRICGKYMPDEVGLHIDHIVPIAKGGKTIPSNLQVLCSKCNGKKATKVTK